MADQIAVIQEKKDNDPETKQQEHYQNEQATRLTEGITFSKQERSSLEAEIDQFFTHNHIVDEEQTLTDSVLEQLCDTFEVTFKTVDDVHKFMYSNTESSPLLVHSYDGDDDNRRIKLLGKVPHNHELWLSLYKQCLEIDDYDTRIKLWMLVQHQTVHLLTSVYRFSPSIRNSLQECVGCAFAHQRISILAVDPQFIARVRWLLRQKSASISEDQGTVVAICADNADGHREYGLSSGGDPVWKMGLSTLVLNLANQYAPAAATHSQSEGGTQEENIFKRTTLYMSLWPHRDLQVAHYPAYEYGKMFGGTKLTEQQTLEQSFYPMDDKNGGIYSQNVYVFRGSQNSGYKVLPQNERCVIASVAVAAGVHQHMGQLSKDEITAYKNKIRTICRIAYEHGHNALV
eukprot:CAMPEP_0202731928 /NCGR_PEP_ID=MMETSP1385-20130828/187398_1 /ASSEMBLY_ACC=CAM_ASM_000861 /TAXON_ID=933848 /ORGANISM="Elphidium margaritaceum" /LENGTH=401 /DNA_ID=CAMNT_0049398231 /DNA_START=22 /DNA_END=1224 /DNA_ORIENTATION=+